MRTEPGGTRRRIGNQSGCGRSNVKRLAILTCFIGVQMILGCGPSSRSKPALSRTGHESQAAQTQTVPKNSADTDPAVEQQIIEFCGDCHRFPSPEHFPKVAWYDEVKRGFGFYDSSGRTDLIPPPREAVVRYFQSRAPEKLLISPPTKSQRMTSVRFRSEQPPHAEFAEQSLVAMASVSWIPTGDNRSGRLFGCDMRKGLVLQFDIARDKLTSRLLANTPNPCQIRISDLDGDSKSEFVIADLGSFLPADHDRGSVIWLRVFEDGKPQTTPLLEKIGRIADVLVLDLDADRDQDLVVAEFGWHKTGGIHVLENRGMKNGQPEFVRHLLDNRPGTIHVSSADLNLDGKPDLIALISQEHESVVAFLNQGGIKFEKRVLDVPQDPSYGSSGMSMVDLDRDNDIDVLLTNGDTFDSYYLKPAHGIEWLENLGDMKFKRHSITKFPGVFRALAGDLDGDSDLDIVAVSLLSNKLHAQEPDTTFDGLIWLEQKSIQQFEWHSIESGNCRHAALELADFDADGDLDLAVPNFASEGDEPLVPLSIWWNQRINPEFPNVSHSR